jgi:hypothetical protein
MLFRAINSPFPLAIGDTLAALLEDGKNEMGCDDISGFLWIKV